MPIWTMVLAIRNSCAVSVLLVFSPVAQNNRMLTLAVFLALLTQTVGQFQGKLHDFWFARPACMFQVLSCKTLYYA